MKLNTGIYTILLLLITALCAPTAALAHNTTGTGPHDSTAYIYNDTQQYNDGPFDYSLNDGETPVIENRGAVKVRDIHLSGDVTHNGGAESSVDMSDTTMTGNVINDGDGDFFVYMTDSEIIGNLNNVSGDGALQVNMDSESSIIGTATVAGDRQIGIDNGRITASGDKNTFEINDGGGVKLVGTFARAASGDLIYSSSGGKVSTIYSMLSGNVTHDGNDAFAMDMRGVSSLFGNVTNSGSGAFTIDMANFSRVIGDVTHSGNGAFTVNMLDSVVHSNISNTGSAGSLDMKLDEGSSFFGKVSTDSGKATNISIVDKDSVWHVRGDSDLGGGNLENNGVVCFSHSDGYKTITTRDLGLNGATGGHFEMKTDIAAQEHDLLRVTGSSNGSYTITVNNDGSAGTTGEECFNLVETADLGATFALTNDIELGAWKYSLRQVDFGTGAAWQLYSNGSSNAGSGALHTVTSTYMLNYAETNTLTQRMGDLRKTPLLSGVWARIHGGKSSIDGMQWGKGFDMKYGGVQVGFDRKIGVDLEDGTGELYAGVMLGYSKGDFDFTHGPSGGKTTSFTTGLYATLMMDNQAYADIVLKYMWMESDFDSYDSGGERITTKYKRQKNSGFAPRGKKNDIQS